MTGTAMTEEAEFEEIYKLDVIEIPTNKPMIRKDHHDIIYKNENAKFRAVIMILKKVIKMVNQYWLVQFLLKIRETKQITR